MPRVGFEPTIPVFERAKTVHALDCAAIVIGEDILYCILISFRARHVGFQILRTVIMKSSILWGITVSLPACLIGFQLGPIFRP
jgi:hypothetical protein